MRRICVAFYEMWLQRPDYLIARMELIENTEIVSVATPLEGATVTAYQGSVVGRCNNISSVGSPKT